MPKNKGVKKGGAVASLYAKRKSLEKEIWTMKVVAYTQQETLDAVSLALNEFFGFGAERLKKFHDAFMAKYEEIKALEHDDAPDHDYYVAKIEQSLQQAWGSHYEPREVRYDFTLTTPEGDKYKL